MAPEVILGMQYNQKADVFSYGIVLCEIITRKKISLELQRSPADAFGMDVAKFKELIPSDCPLEFATLAMECCAYDPNDRPPFTDIVRKLKEIDKNLPAEPVPTSVSIPSSQPAPRPAVVTPVQPAPVNQPAQQQPAKVITPAPGSQFRTLTVVSNTHKPVQPTPTPTPVAYKATTPVSRNNSGVSTPVNNSRAQVPLPTPTNRTPVSANASKPQPQSAKSPSSPQQIQRTPTPQPVQGGAQAIPPPDRSDRTSIKYGGMRLKKTGGANLLWQK